MVNYCRSQGREQLDQWKRGYFKPGISAPAVARVVMDTRELIHRVSCGSRLARPVPVGDTSGDPVSLH
jgi:hypothetical protein